VLQKCVTMLRPRAFQFILNELREESLWQISRNKFGCRIVQRLLEHGTPEQVDAIVGDLQATVLDLCCHPYGNYVVQCMLAHCKKEQRSGIVSSMVAGTGTLCKHHHGISVARAVLASQFEEEQGIVARTISSCPGLLRHLLGSCNGHTVVQLVLDSLDPLERDQAMVELTTNEDEVASPEELELLDQILQGVSRGSREFGIGRTSLQVQATCGTFEGCRTGFANVPTRACKDSDMGR